MSCIDIANSLKETKGLYYKTLLFYLYTNLLLLPSNKVTNKNQFHRACHLSCTYAYFKCIQHNFLINYLY